MTVWPENDILEEDLDDYPCLDEEECGTVCEGACYPYGSEAAYI